MVISETDFQGVYTIDCNLYRDSRGWFYESFRQDKLEQTIGQKINFVQDNQSFSQYGTLRGLHFQKEPYEQAKLVRVLKGEIQDVVVDLRPQSPTYGRYLSVVLSEDNRRQLFVPRGFAHGFLVLSTMAEVFYKCDQFYQKSAEGGLVYNDPNLAIEWLLKEPAFIVSQKDCQLPLLSQI